MKKWILLIAMLSLSMIGSLQAASWQAGDYDLTFRGHVKVDWFHVEGAGNAYHHYNRWANVSSLITPDGGGGRNGFQIFESQLGFGAAKETRFGKSKAYIEMDYFLMLSIAEDQVVHALTVPVDQEATREFWE